MSFSRFFRRARWDEERRRELQEHLAHEIEDNVARGMTPEAAATAAHRKLGNTTLVREEIYQMNTLPFLDALGQDLRYGWRLLRRNPTFSIVAILTLALGTGANAAIFQLVNAVRLRTLPVEKPHELVSIGIDTKGAGRTGRFMSRRPMFSEPLWQSIRAEQQAFSQVFAWGIASWNIATDGEYRPVRGLYVSGEFYRALGVTAQIGRVLNAADDKKGCGAPGAVLTDGFWRSRYGGDPSAVGRTIVLENRPFEIVGVTPPEFFGVEVGRTFDVAVPLCAEPLLREEFSGTGRADTWFLDIMGRLKPGWTSERAASQLEAISPGVFRSTVPEQYDPRTAKEYAAFTFTATPAGTGVSNIRRTYGVQLWVLLGATGLVLLVACANLANLMLARATAREREIAVRLAIGASRRRIVRQMLSESLLIAALGAVGGALLAQWLSRALVAFLSTESDPLFVVLAPDWRVFAFIVALAALECVLFGLSPAVKATGANPGTAMQAGGRASTDSHERFAARRVLVVVQVALSMVLLVGALLFVRSLQNLVTLDPGFEPDGIFALEIDTRRAPVAEETRMQTYQQILERIRTVPGVLSAAEAFVVPMSGSGWNQRLVIDGVEREGNVNLNRVGGDYFRTMETPLLAGRPFGPEDRIGAPGAAIVNESLARKYFGGQNPVGRSFQLNEYPGRPRPHYRIVGLVRDTKYTDLREEFTPIAYLAASQDPEAAPFVQLLVRSGLPLPAISPALTQTVRHVAPGSIIAYSSMAAFVRDSLATERLMAALSGFFGLLALLIATIGLYGVMSYAVTRRKVEIGIRMALGAEPGAVVRMVLGESGALLVAGVAIGVALAIVSSRWAASLLYGLQPWDPASLLLAVTALVGVGILAAWIPAHRAANLAPTIALRE